MSVKAKDGSQKSSFKPDPDLLKGSQFHDNINQIYIRTTEDKLRNFLRDFKDSQSVFVQWSVPLGLVISFGATLLTTSFVEKYGKPASFWEALFTLAFLVSGIWLVVGIVRAIFARKGASIEKLIRKIKNDE